MSEYILNSSIVCVSLQCFVKTEDVAGPIVKAAIENNNWDTLCVARVLVVQFENAWFSTVLRTKVKMF